MAHEHVPPASHGFESVQQLGGERECEAWDIDSKRTLPGRKAHFSPPSRKGTVSAASASEGGCFIAIPTHGDGDGGDLSASAGIVRLGEKGSVRRCCRRCLAGLAGVLLRIGFCEAGKGPKPGVSFLGWRAASRWKWGPREERQGPCAVVFFFF